MSPEGQKQIGKNTLRVLKTISRIDDAVSRATFSLWKHLMKRRGIETYQVGTLGEEQELIKRLKPLLEGAVEIRIPEGDFSEGLFSERPWPPDSRIRITKIPAGDAPEEFRRCWLGIEMDAYKLSPSSEALNLTSGQPVPAPTEDRYAVRINDALRALEQKSTQAAEWFRANVAPNINALSFGSGEVMIIGK